MKVEFNADARVKKVADAEALVALVEAGLERYRERLTRVEVHLKDIDRHRSTIDHRCVIEARPAGKNPVAVTDDGATAEAAVRGAIGKMDRLLGTTFDKQSSHKGNISSSGLPT